MVRSLWTAATGMVAQQTNIDTIANNLSNVNTQGYKTQANEFKTLLYQTLQTRTTSANGEQKPTSAQVGLGVRNSAISTIFRQGPLMGTDNTTDFAIDGKGFFAVRGADGNTYYTRNGNFKFALATNGNMLATSDGLPVMSSAGQPMNEAVNNGLEKSHVIQSYLEGSNVQVVDEMVNMIVAQRAYELNSKAITASDEMLQQANNLRR